MKKKNHPVIYLFLNREPYFKAVALREEDNKIVDESVEINSEPQGI